MELNRPPISGCSVCSFVHDPSGVYAIFWNPHINAFQTKLKWNKSKQNFVDPFGQLLDYSCRFAINLNYLPIFFRQSSHLFSVNTVINLKIGWWSASSCAFGGFHFFEVHCRPGTWSTLINALQMRSTMIILIQLESYWFSGFPLRLAWPLAGSSLWGTFWKQTLPLVMHRWGL